MSNLKIYAVITKIAGKRKMKSYEIQQEILRITKVYYSESTITRRLREMGAKAERPKGKNTTAWSYSL